MYVEKKKTSRLPFVILTTAVLALGGYGYGVAHEADTTWEQTSAAAGAQAAVATTVDIDETKVVIPSWTMFSIQNPWLLVSKQKALPAGYTPVQLVPVGVPHGDSSTPMRIAASIQPELATMFAAAKADGVNLMVSSAYRSEADQRAVYDTYLAKHGSAYVAQYVAAPLQSEHQTGYAADITGASAACEKDSYQCNVTPDVVSWLARHAATYGFIQRYPAGKQSITGVAAEEWHYRYVGIPLAKALTRAGLTFDEFVQQTAPGYAGIPR